MSPIIVRIVGANDALAKTIQYARQQLTGRFGPRVDVRFISLDAMEGSDFPQALALIRLGQAPLPLVFIDDDLFSVGGKISLPAIRRHLNSMGLGNGTPEDSQPSTTEGSVA
jgi:hypothetical protein